MWSLENSLRSRYLASYGREADVITSTNKHHVVSRIAQRLNITTEQAEASVVPLDVRSLTFADALRETRFGDDIDLLQIDAEGYDDRIIMSIDFTRVGVRIINYESCVLPASRLDALSKFLHQFGYVQIPAGADRIALQILQ